MSRWTRPIKPVGTGLSRKVLFALRGVGSSDLKGIREALGKLSAHGRVTGGTVWNILERYRQLGLVERWKDPEEKRVLFQLTRGGIRRVDWLEKNHEK